MKVDTENRKNLNNIEEKNRFMRRYSLTLLQIGFVFAIIIWGIVLLTQISRSYNSIYGIYTLFHNFVFYASIFFIGISLYLLLSGTLRSWLGFKIARKHNKRR